MKPNFVLLFPTEVTSDQEKERKRGNAQTKVAQKSMKLNNDPGMKNISMKRTSIGRKMVRKFLQ